MSQLIIAQHDGNELNPLIANVVTAANQLSGDVDIAILGNNIDSIANKASEISGIKQIITVSSDKLEHANAEHYAKTVAALAANYTHILVASNTFGKNFLPRVAALLDVAQITDMLEVVSDDTFKRPIYAGNAIATVQSSDAIKVITVRATAFDKAALEGGSASINTADAVLSARSSEFKSLETEESEWPDLTAARVVISGGRGLGNGENFKILESLAKKIGDCAIGASRAAVDAGFVPNDYQVGQTGKVVAPELYIAVGLSGAIQHLAGMKDSKVIVAINTDENAPIFEVADYGLVADLFDAIPEIESLL